MTSWNDVTTEQPDLARTIEERFGRYDHHVLATLRADGSPRVSGIEARFLDGELWLGMMPSSRKALDVLRDPRCALHVNPGPGQGMDGGDARIAGRAVEVKAGEPEYRAFVEAFEAPEPFHLFRLDVTEVVRVRVEGETLLTTVWRPGEGLRTIGRGTEEPAAEA